MGLTEKESAAFVLANGNEGWMDMMGREGRGKVDQCVARMECAFWNMTGALLHGHCPKPKVGGLRGN